MTDQVPCIHEDFSSNVIVTRIISHQTGILTGYSADVYVNCAKCNLPFEWVGPPMGLAPDYPTTDLMRHELRAPITPCVEPGLHSFKSEFV